MSGPGQMPTATTDWWSSGSTPRSSPSSTTSSWCGTRVEDRTVEYPVAADNDYEIWNAFDNHYWPALYFIDADGAVRGQHFGEGSYEQSEQTLQRLLGISRDLVSVQGSGVEAAAGLGTPAHARDLPRATAAARTSPQSMAPTTGPGRTRCPRGLPLNHWALDGRWTVGSERAASTRRAGSIAFRFHARDAHLVLSPRTPDADRVPGAPRRPAARPLTRCRRRRGRNRRTARWPHVPAGPRARHRSANAHCRSPSANPVSRRTRSRSDRDIADPKNRGPPGARLGRRRGQPARSRVGRSP